MQIMVLLLYLINSQSMLKQVLEIRELVPEPGDDGPNNFIVGAQ